MSLIGGYMLAKSLVVYSMCGLQTYLYVFYIKIHFHALLILLSVCQVKHYHTI